MRWSEIILIEDDSARAKRRPVVGVRQATAPVMVRIHRILPHNKYQRKLLAESKYTASKRKDKKVFAGRARLVIELLGQLRRRFRNAVIVAGPAYGSNQWFISSITSMGLEFVVALRPKRRIAIVAEGGTNKVTLQCPAQLLDSARWENFVINPPTAVSPVEYSAADLGKAKLPKGRTGRLFAAEIGAIPGVHRGTIFGLSSDRTASLEQLLLTIGWHRWIRSLVRREERQASLKTSTSKFKKGSQPLGSTFKTIQIRARANIALARRHDSDFKQPQNKTSRIEQAHEPDLAQSKSRLKSLNVVELFAGAGGMGLGFLMSNSTNHQYRLAFSGEVNPIYVETLRLNHQFIASAEGFGKPQIIPEEISPLDLRERASAAIVKERAIKAGEIHVVIGGPPCQGFSNANRNSWASSNPNNQLVDTFFLYIEMLRPRLFLMENVQGILWTQRTSKCVGVVDHLATRMRNAGYIVFPKLIDAVWYGVPQYRSRFFLLGLRNDLGYSADDFGEWGPFPKPTHGPGTNRNYISVKSAIADLPQIGNGHMASEMEYHQQKSEISSNNEFLKLMRERAPLGVVYDHVTSRHADYVIERYKQLPPGGNWRNISHLLTNYSDTERTHSNIYRRLSWDEPAITIGHYRKSMIVHPAQPRGLSLREASRLQSFPDWFHFSGGTSDSARGLTHKQQQLANAVCPLVSKAIAEHLALL
jgi:DNA-cytosine methyltransferase